MHPTPFPDPQPWEPCSPDTRFAGCVLCAQEAIKLAEVEFQRERGMVDEVLRRIAQEDCAEVALRRSKQEETKAFIAAFLKEQDEKKRAALESSAKEDRRIAEYWQMVRVDQHPS